MNRRLLFAVVALAAFARPVYADTLTADSAITAVTVFPDRALITRTADLKLEKGVQTIEVGPLPGVIEPDSISARGAGQAEVVLYGVRLLTRQLEQAQDAGVKKLQEEIRSVQQQQQFLHATKQILEQERKYLSSIQAASGEQIGKDLITRAPSAADAAALLAFLDEAFLKNAQRGQESDIALEEAARTLDRLQRELGQLTQGRKQEVAVLVELQAQKAGSFQLEVSYRVFGASWQPGYEARVASASDSVQLAMHGIVRQQTGEDWEDVTLTLSTAKPAVAGTMPELQPWFLKPWEPVVYQKSRREDFRAKLGMADALGGAAPSSPMESEGLDEERDGQKQDKSAALAEAAVQTQGPSVSFILPKQVSIASDWQPQKQPIGVHALSASMAYEATPRLLPSAFLRAKVKNATEATFLSGPVAVFLDGAFIATAHLKQVAPTEEFDLYLGVDERIKVERRALKERVEVSLIPGLRGKTKATDYEFLTTINNFTGRKASITVTDLVPVSQREEIVVESVKQTPSEAAKDDEKPGIFRWQLELAPNQKQELRLSYRVRHPVDMQIQ